MFKESFGDAPFQEKPKKDEETISKEAVIQKIDTFFHPASIGFKDEFLRKTIPQENLSRIEEADFQELEKFLEKTREEISHLPADSSRIKILEFAHEESLKRVFSVFDKLSSRKEKILNYFQVSRAKNKIGKGKVDLKIKSEIPNKALEFFLNQAEVFLDYSQREKNEEGIFGDEKEKNKQKTLEFAIKSIERCYELFKKGNLYWESKNISKSGKTILKSFGEKKVSRLLLEKNIQNFLNFTRVSGYSDFEKDALDFLEENDQEKNRRLIMILCSLSSAEELRKKLDLRINENRMNKKDEKAENLLDARSFFTPDDKGIAIENLKKFYEEKIKFEDYRLNKKMNDKEVELLKKLIGKNEKVLEMGCGTGRLLLEMKKNGYDITGFDFSDHVGKVKEADLEAKVFEGDWHQIGAKNESFDVVYSLGRNILHDYSFFDQIQMFREANRILKKGGKFIFDIPNREKGSYKKMVEEYAGEMRKRGVKQFRYGSIYDSPDGKYFATRYAFSREDIEDISRITGFTIKDVRIEKLETGKGDENVYYVLEKTD